MRKLSSEELHTCWQYVSNVHPNLLAMEMDPMRRPPADFLNTVQRGKITASDMVDLVDFMMEMAQHLDLPAETRHLAVSLVDRFLCTKPLPFGAADLGLLGTASLHLEAKYEEEVGCPNLADFLDDNFFTRKEVFAMESDVLTSLNYVMHDGPNAIYFLWGFAAVDREHDLLREAASYIAERSLRDHACRLRFLPSEVAAASVFSARCHYGRPWTPAMSKAIGYEASCLKECIIRMHAKSLPLIEKSNIIDIFAAVNGDQTCSEPNLAALSLN